MIHFDSKEICEMNFIEHTAYLLNKLVGVAEGNNTCVVEAELLLKQLLGDVLESVSQIAHNEQSNRVDKTNGVCEEGLCRNKLLPKFTKFAAL